MDKAGSKRKNICGRNLGPRDLNYAQNEIFCYFCGFGSYVFLDIACSDNLKLSRGTTHKKFFGDPMFGRNKPKFGLQLGFSSFSQVWFISFPWNYIQW